MVSTGHKRPYTTGEVIMKCCNNDRKTSTHFSNGSVTITWSLTVINAIYLKAPLMSLVLK